MAHVMRNTFILMFLLAVPLEAITVSPSLCPTNKIAPHKRISSWSRPSYRTFAAFHDLLTPNTSQYQGPQGPQSDPQDSLQEQPQDDQPDDCGEIEDYDENDISSVTQVKRRQGRVDNRFFFSGIFRPPQQPQPQPPQQQPPQQQPPQQQPPQYPLTTTRPLTRPPKPQVPSYYYPPMRPPYWSGGLFSNNQYQPPPHEDPTDNFKPVHEAAHFPDAPQPYRPGIVGGPIGHVVGVTQARPTTTPPSDEYTRRRLSYLANHHTQSTQPTMYSTRRPRPRKLNDDSVIGSFIDLFFK